MDIDDTDSRLEELYRHLTAAGLTRDRTARVEARVSPRLLERARERVGAVPDDRLIEIALAALIEGDLFSEAFRAMRGTVSPDLDLDP